MSKNCAKTVHIKKINNNLCPYIGAANKAAPNLFKILTLLPFFSMCLHKYISAFNHLAPILYIGTAGIAAPIFRLYIASYTNRQKTANTRTNKNILRIFSMFAAPLYWCKMVSSTNVLVNYIGKLLVCSTLPV